MASCALCQHLPLINLGFWIWVGESLLLVTILGTSRTLKFSNRLLSNFGLGVSTCYCVMVVVVVFMVVPFSGPRACRSGNLGKNLGYTQRQRDREREREREGDRGREGDSGREGVENSLVGVAGLSRAS